MKLDGSPEQRHLQDLPDDAQGEDEDAPDFDLGKAFGLACFSDVATVQVQDRSDGVAMKDLQIGDMVWNGDSFSSVYAFGHYSPNTKGEFLQIHHTQSSGKSRPLEITGEHLLYLHGQSHPVRADSVSVGDSLQGPGSSLKVTKIDKVEKTGLYTPLTPEGTVVVDGIKASSYVSLQAGNDFMELQTGAPVLGLSMHEYIHMGLSPMRLLCMGVSSQYCNTQNEDGMPFYITLSVQANQWISKQHMAIQVVLFSVIIFLTGISMALENVFGPSLAPLAVLSLATALLAINRKKQTKQKLA